MALLAIMYDTALAGSEETLQVRWQEVEALVEDKDIRVLLREGIQLKGRVTGITPNSMHMLVKDTSDEQNYPQGQNAIPESSVQTIRYTVTQGPWRAIGAAAGAGVGIPAARAVSFSSGSKSIGKTTISHIAVIPAMTLIGYFVGRVGDRHHIVLKVVR